MKANQLPFHKTGYFSNTMLDYLDGKENIRKFYNNPPDLEGFKSQIKEKKGEVDDKNRAILVASIQNQYKGFSVSEETQTNLDLLKSSNTFTITTGHQLNLFTGPLYFLYKIISAINLSEKLKDNFPESNFVPVYWMATEDHDFEEINYFNFKGKKVQWNRRDGGPVGRFSLDGLDNVLNKFSQHIGTSKNAERLKELFKEAYLNHNDLASATRYLANELFRDYGLVIVDGDDRELKTLFSSYVKEELENQTSFSKVTETIKELERNYKIQVNPREINLFYITDEIRERIVFEDGVFKINNTNLIFTKNEVLEELDKFPERFSPNVLLRPLYQEVILPNLCYIGGGGELAYWMQLKDYFNSVKVSFPILMLRDSVLLLSQKQISKLDKLNIDLEELFLKQRFLIDNKITESSDLHVNFDELTQVLNSQFANLREVATQTEQSFIGAVNAQEKKQIKGLQNLKKRLLRAERRNQEERVMRITDLKELLFPNDSLQERTSNFSEFYLEYGDDLITGLKSSLDPLKQQFTILNLG